MKRYHMKRLVCFTLLLAMAMSFSLAAGASEELLSYPVQEAIASEETVQRGEIQVDLTSGQSIRKADYEALQDTKKPVTLRYPTISWAMEPGDMGDDFLGSSLALWRVDPSENLVEAVAAATGLEETEFMLVQANYQGVLPAVCTVGICLDQDFMNHNGTTGINLYGLEVDTVKNGDTTDYRVTEIGLYSSGNEVEKPISPWIYMKTNVSRVWLLTTEELSGLTQMDFVVETAATAQEAERVDGDANPNTGDSGMVSLFLGLAILSLAGASVALVRNAMKK